MTKKLLVTTSIEETWEINNRHIIFLGEWCKLFNKKEKWENISHETVQYHWNDREKILTDFNKIIEIYERVLVDLSDVLNKIHNVNYSVKYWRILIGVWLLNFIQIFYDRYEMIKKVAGDYISFETIIIVNDENNLIPSDIIDFMRLSANDDWNHFIYSLIIPNFSNINIIKSQKKNFDKRNNISSNSNRIGFYSSIKKLYNFIYKKFTKKTDALFISTFLSKKNQVFLSLKFFQLPLLYREEKLSFNIKLNNNYRNLYVEGESKNDFEKLLRAVILKQIPISYLEGFNQLKLISYKTGWPSNPKLIFTSNSHYGDDVFKIYAAEKVENGSPLIIGQHGGNYGTAKWITYEQIELAICDKYLSWGWKDINNPKIKPIGKFVSDKKIKNFHLKENMLLVTLAIPRFSYTMYSSIVSSQWLKYFEDQCLFISNLNISLRKKLILRLYKSDYGWEQYERYKERFPELIIDKAQNDIYDQITKTKIYISTYNATTFLESLNINLPTIIYWDPQFWELRDTAIPYYDELRKVGILHDSPEKAATFINEIWDCVDVWWNSNDVINAKNNFKQHFCHYTDNILNNIISELQEISVNHNE